MAFNNRLLDRLEPGSSAAFFSEATLESTGLEDRIDDAGELPKVVFPATAVISLLAEASPSRAVELATVGSEGFVGIPVALGASRFPSGQYAQTQVPGAVWTIPRKRFTALMDEWLDFRALMWRSIQAYQSQLARQVVCNALHNVDQRISRWLLVTADRAYSDEFPMTQEFLSQMLGVRRATVNSAAQRLQNAGVISYKRGVMRILDRSGLAAQSCDCYRVLRIHFEELLGPRPDR